MGQGWKTSSLPKTRAGQCLLMFSLLPRGPVVTPDFFPMSNPTSPHPRVPKNRGVGGWEMRKPRILGQQEQRQEIPCSL